MLCCETCGGEPRDLEDLAVFVSQLAAAGVAARVHVGSMPEAAGRNVQFDLAPFLVDRPLRDDDHVSLIGAHRLTDDRLAALRRLAAPGVACSAFGAFPSRQAEVGVAAKLAYAFGAEPQVHDIPDGGAGDPMGRATAPVFGVAQPQVPGRRPQVLLVAPDLADPREAAGLAAMSLSRHFRVLVLTDGRAKADWQARHGTELAVFHYGEVLPAALARLVDVCVAFRPAGTSYRVQSLFANLARSGVPLLDATEGHVVNAASEAFVRAPAPLTLLAPFLETDVLPNRDELGRRVAASALAARVAPERIIRRLGAVAAPPPAPAAARVTMVPTNGIGLGHAKRCALIGRELQTAARPVVAAFPSCTALIKSFGFDVMPLVPRSRFHRHSFENDLANYLRLRALTAGGGTVVFDGGYVFDSIFRTILNNRLSGVWVRRGLWQASQNNTVTLDREKVFARVIVPREAFDELNTPYSRGAHVREVGPVVEGAPLAAASRDEVRRALAERFGLPFERLVVSLLGGGVAADRTAQVQALCGMMERRTDTLHLVVVWPGAVQEPVWFRWSRTRIVRTVRATTLVAAADLCIGAAGYNLFHDVLYAGAPTIFVPQSGPFMDDQTARARAAAERGLAAHVEAPALMRLDREVARFLDGGEAEAVAARLAAADLPAPGNAAAAREIREVSDGDAADTGDRRAHLSGPRG